MEKAERALHTLNKNDISEIKTFQNPPAGIPTCCKLSNYRCSVSDGSRVYRTRGKVVINALNLEVKTDWTSARSLLSEPDFLQSLINYDKDNTPPRIIASLKKYITN